jgi:MFS family permease
LTGLGAGGVVSAPFPIASELMPAQHRRTYSAVYEMSLASSFTVVPFIAGLLAGNVNAFRFLALPGGLAVTVIPVIVYFALPGSPRWHLHRGRPQVAVDIVNRIIARCGNRVPPLTVEALGDTTRIARRWSRLGTATRGLTPQPSIAAPVSSGRRRAGRASGRPSQHRRKNGLPSRGTG